MVMNALNINGDHYNGDILMFVYGFSSPKEIKYLSISYAKERSNKYYKT